MTDIKTTYIPQRLRNVSADHPYVAGTVDIFDDRRQLRQSTLNKETEDELDKRYTKNETYSKAQINNMISSSQNYVTVTADSETTQVTDVLPATGEPGIVYKVGNWDGTQYDTTVYSEYAWDGSAYVLLDAKQYTLASAADFNNPDGSARGKIVGVGAAFDVYGGYENGPGWAKVVLDSSKRILYGVKDDGSFYFGAGVPEQVREMILEYEDKFAPYESLAYSSIYSSVNIDEQSYIISGIKKDGTFYISKLESPTLTAMDGNVDKLNDRLTTLSTNIMIGAGDFLAQNLYAYTSFRNIEASNTYFRKDGNIWVDDGYVDTVINPVTKYDAADPSYIKVGEYFYMFRTGKPCYIDRSKDLVNWEKNYSRVFPADFDYSQIPDMSALWANDINYIDGKYVDYIAVWTGNTNSSYTIVMYADDIEGPWEYGGIIAPSYINDGPNFPIDPEYVNDGENGYLIVGSFRGIYMAQLAADGLSVVSDWTLIGKAADDLTTQDNGGEGSYVYKYNGYYYLFLSMGFYRTYSYHLGIVRAETLGANFVNKDGVNLLEGTPTTVLYSDDGDILFGPGHNAEIYVDGNGDMYMILHCHVKGLFASDLTRPAIIMRIVEGEDGWLAFADMDGNVIQKPTWTCTVPLVINEEEDSDDEDGSEDDANEGE